MRYPSRSSRSPRRGPLSSLAALPLAVLLTVACGGDGGGATAPQPTTGSLEVRAATSGDTLDLDGYAVTAAGQTQSLAVDGSVTFTELEAGDYSVEVAGIQKNCAPDGPNPATATVTAGTTTSIVFDVTCRAALFDRIVFSSHIGSAGFELVVISPDGSGRLRLTDNSSDDLSPSVSPDGTRIVFESDVDGDFEIYSIDVDGTNRIQLTSNDSSDEDPVWSPEGDKIAFATDREGDYEIYTMNPDGTGQTPVTANDTWDIEPGWSPDGSALVFVSANEIYTIGLDGSSRTRLTNMSFPQRNPAWSPDGAMIAWESTQPGPNRDIYTMSASDGSEKTRLTNHADYDGRVAWSPDGTKLAFMSQRDATLDIFSMNADGTGLLNLTSNPSDPTTDDYPVWTPLR